ncbi:hypothetical protein IVB11_10510 [Bradyrhizobium sp. 177]|uniref:hypothetical protein n=1 Tax=Bradyrhizobium sp. 177 TaxID=2782647 RepID=UPI001FF86464|nr:hypothetical protein [Bradyrhizobium sp. 177]MCK1549484.1 hypothetical protein [Bradyrhizobium sp. 177]
MTFSHVAPLDQNLCFERGNERVERLRLFHNRRYGALRDIEDDGICRRLEQGDLVSSGGLLELFYRGIAIAAGLKTSRIGVEPHVLAAPARRARILPRSGGWFSSVTGWRFAGP